MRYRFSEGPSRPDPLLASITQRQSTRAEYDGRSVSADDVGALLRAAALPGVRMVLLTERGQMDRLRDLVVAGNSAQMADPAFMRELKQWLRFNPRSAMRTGDGLFSAASGNPMLPDALGSLALDQFFTAEAENDKYARHVQSSAGIAVFVADREDKAHWIAVGRACQRFALTATASWPEARFHQPAGGGRRPAPGSGRARRRGRQAPRHRHALRLRTGHALFRPASRRVSLDLDVRLTRETIATEAIRGALVWRTREERWRRGWDSNPREAFDLYSLSRGAPSTTRPPLRWLPDKEKPADNQQRIPPEAQLADYLLKRRVSENLALPPMPSGGLG